jgi:hypothetical protein
MFSANELELALSRDFILTKNAVIQKVYGQFGALGNGIFKQLQPLQIMYPEVFGNLPKISRGENYHGFPWVMLDYPRSFDKEKGHCAMRTLFLWGHYYLVQIQVSKNFSSKFFKKVQDNPAILKEIGFPIFCGYPADPYNFLLPQNDLQPYQYGMPDQKDANNYGIFKLVVQVPIERGHQLESLLPSLATLFLEDV